VSLSFIFAQCLFCYTELTKYDVTEVQHWRAIQHWRKISVVCPGG